MKNITPNWFQKVAQKSLQLGEENQFGSTRGLRFGPLKINKTGISANNGTVDSVIVDSNGFHGYDNTNVETIKIDNTGLHGYSATGTEQIAILPSGAFGYGNNYTSWQFTDVVGGTVKGAMGYNSSSTPASFTIMGTASALQCGTLAGNSAFYTSSGNLFVASNIGSGGGSIYVKGESTDSLVNSGFYVYDFASDGYIEKTAIVPTSNGYNALYCTESPEVWFMDFARYEKKWWQSKKKAKIICDEMFLEVTSPPYIVMPTLNKNLVQIWGKRKGLEHKRFESKTKEQFDKNNAFWDTPNIKSSKSL